MSKKGNTMSTEMKQNEQPVSILGISTERLDELAKSHNELDSKQWTLLMRAMMLELLDIIEDLNKRCNVLNLELKQLKREE